MSYKPEEIEMALERALQGKAKYGDAFVLAQHLAELTKRVAALETGERR